MHATAGSLAGLAEHVLMYPFDTVKTHAQARGKVESMLAMLKREVAKLTGRVVTHGR